MRRTIRCIALLFAALGACGGGGGGDGQINFNIGWRTLYQSNFDDAAAQSGWTTSGGLWSFRATPAGWSDRGTGLYYNDGVDYDDSTANSGFVASPHLSFEQDDGATLSFSCIYHIDPTETDPDADRREVWIQIPGGGAAQTYKIFLKRQGAADPTGAYDLVVTCGTAELWHTHSIDFSSAWQKFGFTTDVTLVNQVHFLFTTGDADSNQGKGWGIDELSVTAIRFDVN